MTTDIVTRWVISHIGSKGLRRLTFAQQGRDTYGSPHEARRALKAFTTTGLQRVLTDAELSTLEVRAVACHRGHHDPVAYYLDRFTVQSGTIYRDGVPFVRLDTEELGNGHHSMSPTERDALNEWLCDRLNEPSFNLAAIHRAHMER